jgi:hypothetical protein
MYIFAALLTLLVLRTRAINLLLFEDDNCTTEDEPALTCFGATYNTCCGTITTKYPDGTVTGQLYGAVVVSIGGTAIQNTPIPVLTTKEAALWAYKGLSKRAGHF